MRSLPAGVRPLPPTRNVLAALARMQDREAALALWVARQPLTLGQWACVPSPCAPLAAVLPAVVRRSRAEAAQVAGR